MSGRGEIRTVRAEVAGTLISDYLYREVARPRELIMLLHGYQQSGKSMMDRLESCCPPDAAILAPNGPYPLPERKQEGGIRLGFSWYFYNPKTDEYFIDMKVALELLGGLVRALGFEALPKRVIGFSQGGYLAPFAALAMNHATQVIGIASEFLADELDEALRARRGSWPSGLRADVVHGKLDDVVSVESALRGFEAMRARGVPGEWVCLESEGHRITPAMRDAVGGLLGRV